MLSVLLRQGRTCQCQIALVLGSQLALHLRGSTERRGAQKGPLGGKLPRVIMNQHLPKGVLGNSRDVKRKKKNYKGFMVKEIWQKGYMKNFQSLSFSKGTCWGSKRGSKTAALLHILMIYLKDPNRPRVFWANVPTGLCINAWWHIDVLAGNGQRHKYKRTHKHFKFAFFFNQKQK